MQREGSGLACRGSALGSQRGTLQLLTAPMALRLSVAPLRGQTCLYSFGLHIHRSGTVPGAGDTKMKRIWSLPRRNSSGRWEHIIQHCSSPGPESHRKLLEAGISTLKPERGAGVNQIKEQGSRERQRGQCLQRSGGKRNGLLGAGGRYRRRVRSGE